MSKNAGTSSPRRPKSSSADGGAQRLGARGVAARVLARVWRDGAYAMPALDAELRRHPDLDARDARLATELVYGVLRTCGWLERRVSKHASNDRWKTKPGPRAHILMAAYALFFLRIPAHAAVDEAVGSIKAGADRKIAGFANAVLRKLAREAAEGEPPSLQEAIVQGAPAWLERALGEAIGSDQVAAYLQAGPFPPRTSLCLRSGQARDAWLTQLREAAPDGSVEPGSLSPRAIALSGVGDIKRLPGANAAWTVQEEGAQIIALAVGAQPGDRVLDACAGRGSKALLLAELVGSEGAVDAADLHPNKLAKLRAASGARAVRSTYAVDWTRGSGAIEERYDRVLVDAPCSGVGTLRRRPEIVLRLRAHDVTRMAALQLEITRRAAERVEPGGRLVYAVCSVLGEECEGVVAALLEPREGARRVQAAPFDSALGAQLAGDACSFRLLPHVHGTDGYFVASFVVE